MPDNLLMALDIVAGEAPAEELPDITPSTDPLLAALDQVGGEAQVVEPVRPVAMPPTQSTAVYRRRGAWQTPEALAESQAIEEEQNRSMAEQGAAMLVENLPGGSNAFVRNTAVGAAQAGTDLYGQVARLLDLPAADRLHQQGQELEQIAAIADENSVAPAWLNRGLRGTTRSLANMAMTPGVGATRMAPSERFKWIIAQAMTNRGNQAIGEAQDAGLDGAEMAGYAGRAATIEGSIAAIFQRLGLGGLEKTVVGESIKQGVGNGLRQFGVNTLQELPEEIITEVLDAVNQELSGVNPEATTPESLLELVRDTTVQTVMSLGVVQGGQTLARLPQARRERQLQRLLDSVDPQAQTQGDLEPVSGPLPADAPFPLTAEHRAKLTADGWRPEEIARMTRREAETALRPTRAPVPREELVGSEDDVAALAKRVRGAPDEDVTPTALPPIDLEAGETAVAEEPVAAANLLDSEAAPQRLAAWFDELADDRVRTSDRAPIAQPAAEATTATGATQAVPPVDAAEQRKQARIAEARRILDQYETSETRKVAPAARPEPKQDANEWKQFPEESGTKRIPREEMPQIQSEHRGALSNYLRARGIEWTREENVDPETLKATQAEYSTAKVRKAKEHTGEQRAILVSADGHVLDGHHQWLAALEGNQTLPVIRLAAPIEKLLEEVKGFPSAEAASGAPTTAEPTTLPAPRSEPANERTETPRTAVESGTSQQQFTPTGKTFTTERGGSVYEIDSSGRTQRTKGASGFQHAGDVGLKDASDRTVYVSPADADVLGAIYASGPPKDKRTTMALNPDGTITLRRWFGVKNGEAYGNLDERTIQTVAEPAVGLHPVEFLPRGSQHIGSKITAVQGGEPEKSTAEPAPVTASPAPFTVGDRARYVRGKRKGTVGTVKRVLANGRVVLKGDNGKLLGSAGGITPDNLEVVDGGSADATAPVEGAEPATPPSRVAAPATGTGVRRADRADQPAERAEAPPRESPPVEPVAEPADVDPVAEPAEPAPAATPAPVATKAKGKPGLKDFGQKIGGARKDVWAARGLSVADLEKMTDTERQAYATKDEVWPVPEYAALVEAGMPAPVAWLVKGIRDKLASVPTMDRQTASDPERRSAAQRRYVEIVGTLRDRTKEVRSIGDITAAVRAALPDLSYRSTTDYKLVARDAGLWKALMLGEWDLTKAKRQVEKTGWPGGEPWQRVYRVQEIPAGSTYGRRTPDGQWISERLTTSKFEIAYNAKSARGQLAGGPYDTREEAVAAAKAAFANRRTGTDGKPKLERPVRPDAARVGQDHRGGRDVSGDDILDAFGFRGGEFGNWTSQADRQQSLNQAYDGLMDLAAVLGVPPRALGLNGQLGIAFGARGHGSASAHYEPGQVVINLTRMKGAGALAHEWWHAVDDYFGRMGTGGQAGKMVSSGVRMDDQVRAEVQAAWAAIMSAITTRDVTKAEVVAQEQKRVARAQKVLTSWVEGARRRFADKATAEQVAAFEEAVADIVNKPGEPVSVGAGPNSTDRIEAAIKALSVRGETRDALRQGVNTLQWAQASMAKAIAGEILRRGDTKLLEASKKVDEDRSSPYWSTRHELFARAGEAWVQDRLEQMGADSPYLVTGTKPGGSRSGGGKDRAAMLPEDHPWWSMYPKGEEREAINAAFDKLAATLKTEETPEGRTRLYAPDRDTAEDAVEEEPERLNQRERTPGETDERLEMPDPDAGIESLIGWALAERSRTIAEMNAKASRTSDPELAEEYAKVAAEYEAVDPQALAGHMRAFPAHYYKAMSAQGGNMDPVQVYRKRADLPPVESRVLPEPIPLATGEKLPDLRATLKRLNQDLKKASPSAPPLTVDRGETGDAGGFFDTRSGQVAVKYHNDLDLTAHEVGHWAAETYGLMPPEGMDEARGELARFGVHGSPAKGTTRLREGMAEYLRGWMVNPGATEARAPKFTAYAREKLPASVWDALRRYGDDVRRFEGASAVQQVAAGAVPITKAMATEKAAARWYRMILDGLGTLFGSGKRRVDGRGGTVPKHFTATKGDKVRFALTDKEAPALTNYVTALGLVGIDPAQLQPSRHWDFLRKEIRGQAGRLRDMVLQHGLTSPGLEVAHDPETGERMTLAWLLEPVTRLGDRWSEVLDRAHAYGIAERTGELEERYTRQNQEEIDTYSQGQLQEAGNDAGRLAAARERIAEFTKQKRAELRAKLARLTPAGGGLHSAAETARKALGELERDPDSAAVKDYLRRYRLWANWNLTYAVQSELLTPEQAERIQEANQQYIDWHRVFGDDDGPINIGQAVDGSMRTIHNPLASLLHATWSVVSRGDRNRLMQTFVAPLRMSPVLHQGRSLASLGHTISKVEAEEAFSKHQGYHDDAAGNRQRVYRVQRLEQVMDPDGDPMTDRDGKPATEIRTEYWVFDSGTEASLEAGRALASDHPWMQVMQGLNSLQRSMIVLAPSFRLKVPVRDNIERILNSEVGSGVRDIPKVITGKVELDGRDLEELFSLSGASMAGWNQHTREQALAEVFAHVETMQRSGWSVLTPQGMWRWWQKFGESSENVARKAEYAAAYRKARADGMTVHDAALYAAAQSRGLLDTAESGHLIGQMNGITLFLNAHIQGVRRTTRMIRMAAAAYRRGDAAAGNALASAVALRTITWGGVLMLLRWMFLAGSDDEEQRELLAAPAWKRDFAIMLPEIPGVGKIAIPKPYEWGWLGSGFERMADFAWAKKRGWTEEADRAYEGYGKSFIGAVMPVDQDILGGSLMPMIEVATNKSLFTQAPIVSKFEEGLDLDRRKGTENASLLGRTLQDVLRVDARNIDHLIRGYFGGFGSMATARDGAEFVKRASGYSGNTSTWSSRDVAFVLDHGDRRGIGSRKAFVNLRDKLKAARDASGEDRNRLEAEAREYARKLRAMIEQNPEKFNGPEKR